MSPHVPSKSGKGIPDESVWVAFCEIMTECYSKYKITNFRLDKMILSRRYSNEGLSFLGGLLGNLLHCHNRGLEDGVFPDIKSERLGVRCQRNSCLPRLFYGLWRRLYTDHGVLILDDANIATIEIDIALRQLLAFVGKINAEIDERNLLKQEESFISTDLSVERPGWSPGVGSDEEGLLRTAEVVARDVLKDFELEPFWGVHGPGAVYEQLDGVEKDFYVWRLIPLQLVDLYRSDRTFDLPFFLTGTSAMLAHVSDVLLPLLLMTDDEYLDFRLNYDSVYVYPHGIDVKPDMPVSFLVDTAHRAVYVPKTFEKKRRIGAESVALQAMQQGIKGQLQPHLERYGKDSWPGGMFFTDQSINQFLALYGSGTGEAATIDSTSASDLVGLWHLEKVLKDAHPQLFKLLMASRSSYSRLYKSNDKKKHDSTPDYLLMRKFAGMGSACTFPIESLYFFAIAVATIAINFIGDDLYSYSEVDARSEENLRKRRRQISENLKRAVRHVTVYGDDVILNDIDGGRAMDMWELVKKSYESLGGQVNCNKSFGKGAFRESCGCDAVMGVDVTPIKLRETLPTGKPVEPKDFPTYTSKIVSYCETANLLFERGYPQASEAMFSLVRKRFGSVPRVPITLAEQASGIVQWVKDDSCLRQSPDFHFRELRLPKSSAVPHVKIGYVAMLPHTKTKHIRNVTDVEFLAMQMRSERLTKEPIVMTPGLCQNSNLNLLGADLERGEASKLDKRHSSSLFLFKKDRKKKKGDRGTSKPFVQIRRRFVELSSDEVSPICDMVCATCPHHCSSRA